MFCSVIASPRPDIDECIALCGSIPAEDLILSLQEFVVSVSLQSEPDSIEPVSYAELQAEWEAIQAAAPLNVQPEDRVIHSESVR